jgi:hypothetical protein
MAAKAIPQGDAWLHEPKLDSYRFQIVTLGPMSGRRNPRNERTRIQRRIAV